ncbi:hypothetical protein [Agriterribacter sp.]|uniref:hypothetical protein n=1 Tax=Agriterribacter sp. TaxID=2821509 RepID=UPI002C55E22F|nr:hypothetical protein [Agriterribacter sp.]HRP57110.1 hypothetical protein [Agriterribacter sp.]
MDDIIISKRLTSTRRAICDGKLTSRIKSMSIIKQPPRIESLADSLLPSFQFRSLFSESGVRYPYRLLDLGGKIFNTAPAEIKKTPITISVEKKTIITLY